MTATEPGRDEMISIVMKQASYITRGMACKIVDAILPRLSTPADQAVREATIAACANIADEWIYGEDAAAAIRSLTTEPKRS